MQDPNFIELKNEYVKDVSTRQFPFIDEQDHSWSLEKFKVEFQMIVTRKDDLELEFDLIGIHSSIANAIRRVLHVEVPTMAIESVFVLKNTSIMDDAMLSQRLGLIPILVDPSKFDFRAHNEEPTDLNTIVFKLKKECTKNPDASPDELDPNIKFKNHTIYSGDLVWEPAGEQESRFGTIKPLHDDIVLTNLTPGQELDLEVHCQKGIGKEHIKWSPVSTATYRLLPRIDIVTDITGDDAVKFQSCFPKGTIAIVDGNAVVANMRKETGCREALRHKEFQDKVKIGRVRNHFLYSIESANGTSPEILLDNALDVLIEKCKTLESALDRLGILNIDEQVSR